jgi:hypothetical protein
MGLLTGCKSSDSDLELSISFIAWKTNSEIANSCAEGPEVADFLDEGATVSVYDEANGELLASGKLTENIDPEVTNPRLCAYSLDYLKVPLVDNYRIVVDSRHTEISSATDLKVTANEFPVSSVGSKPDLYLVKEFGWP